MDFWQATQYTTVLNQFTYWFLLVLWLTAYCLILCLPMIKKLNVHSLQGKFSALVASFRDVRSWFIILPIIFSDKIFAQNASDLQDVVKNEALLVWIILIVATVLCLLLFIASYTAYRLYQESLQFDALTSLLPDGVIYIDTDLNIVYSNASSQKLFGYGFEEMHSRCISEFLPSLDKLALCDINYGNRPVEIPLIVFNREQDQLQVEILIERQIFRRQKCHILVIKDVSKRLKQEHHLKLLVAALEQARDGIAIITKDHEILLVNKAMSLILSNSIKKFGLSELLEETPEILASMEVDGSWQGSLLISNQDSSKVYVDISATAIDLGSNMPSSILLVYRDITDLKKGEAALTAAKESAELATQSKSEFLAVMSHEIRTPINGLLGLSNMLSDTDLDKEQFVLLGLVQQSGENLLEIINDILDFSKIESGKLQIDDAPMSLKDLLQDVFKLFSHTAREKDVSIELVLAQNLPRRVYGDAGRIKQILLNLIGNALKFTLQGKVTVSLSVKPSTIPNITKYRIGIADTGIGIKSTSLDHIFESFAQADVSTSRQFGGTGLGLPITKRLVQLMGGEIGVTSIEGQGSEFWFELPLAAMEPSVSTQKKQAPIAVNYRGTHVLLIEDNPVNRMVAVHMLRKFGCTVDTADGGQEGVACTKDKIFDIIFMDCSMPEVDGFEATKLIRTEATNPNRQSPIVALTAHAMKGDREACLDAGMDDYLTKPINALKLTKVLNKWKSGVKLGANLKA
ncbi:MAG: PAS domain S-box-containing protein [Candidatus Azotimanducaceae bacterium]|jgi:PAS domain S-box-containing protein